MQATDPLEAFIHSHTLRGCLLYACIPHGSVHIKHSCQQDSWCASGFCYRQCMAPALLCICRLWWIAV